MILKVDLESLKHQTLILYSGVIVHYDGTLSIWDGVQNVDFGDFKCIGNLASNCNGSLAFI